jgi:predicted dehydrogenase
VVIDGDFAAPGFPPRTSEICELVGTRATALLHDQRLTLTSDGAAETFEYEREPAYQQSVDDCIGHFVDCLRSGAPFETAPRDNLETLRLVEDSYRLAGPVRELA